MTSKRYAGIVLVILLIGLSYYYVTRNSVTTDTETTLANTEATTTPVVATGTTPKTGTAVQKGTTLSAGNTAGFNSYTNVEYNFTVKYPSYVQVYNGFSTFHDIGNNWRLYAGLANQGKSVVSFSVHKIDKGTYSTTYPLYFTSEVRIGVSPNVKECYTPDASYPNQKVTTVTINGVQWRKFSTTETTGTKYIQSESYRTVRNNSCFAIEQIKNGSTYIDDKMTVATPESALVSYYNAGDAIVRTFRFTK